MDITAINRWTLLVLLCSGIYAVHTYTKVTNAQILNLNKTLENLKLDGKIKEQTLKYVTKEYK